MFPAIRWRISSRLGAGRSATRATALTIWPGVQYPHCTASARTNAATSGWSRSPSIVVTSSLTRWASVMHESVGRPPTSTVQAPQWPSPQAVLVPVSPISSRKTSAREAPASAPSSYRPPLIVSSGTRHRLHVCDVDQPHRQAEGREPLALVAQVRQPLPERARGAQQLADPIDRRSVPVSLGTGVDRQPERPQRVLLA